MNPPIGTTKQTNFPEQIMKHADMGIIIISKKGNIEFINNFASKLLKYREGELVGKSILKIYPDFKANEIRSLLEKFPSEQTSSISKKSVSFRDKDTLLIPVVFIVSSIGPNGEKDGVLIVFREIQKKKQLDEERYMDRERFRFLVENQIEGVLITDLLETITYANASAEKVFGVKKSELINRNLKEFLSEEQFKFLKSQTKLRYKGEKSTYELELMPTPHRKITIEVNAAPIFNTEGKLTETFAVFRDITENKGLKERAEYEINHDYLTKLYNRKFLFEQLDRISHDLAFTSLGAITCDLNGLKNINDALGHDKGDETLIVASELLKGNVRRYDITARTGGDEFVILLPGVSKPALEARLKRIQTSLTNHNRKTLDIFVSLALGCAWTNKRQKDNFKKLLDTSDHNMYKAKPKKEETIRQVSEFLLRKFKNSGIYREKHYLRTKRIASQFGRALQLSSMEINVLRNAIDYMDIGKLKLSEKILNEKELTPKALKIYREHSEYSYRIVKNIFNMPGPAEVILHHHERYDGKGYPMKLKKDSIPLLSRILAVISAFDAIVMGKASRIKPALQALRREAGKQFDPELVKRFVQIME